MPNTDKIAVEKDGKTVLIDRKSVDVYLKFGYKPKGKQVTVKEEE